MAKNGKHNIEKRGTVWYFSAKKNGKRYHEALSTNLREAKQIRDDLLHQLKQFGCLVKDTVSQTKQIHEDGLLLGEVAKVWIEVQDKRVKQDQIKASSLRDYKSSMNCHILPRFGNTPINSLTASDIDDFVLTLECSGKRIKNILVPLRSLFKMGKKKGLVQEDIMKEVDNPKVIPADIYPLSAEEVQVFLEHCPIHYQPFFTVLFYTGMRFGEIAVLKWRNVDLVREFIKVRETLVYGEEGRVKTARSNRDVDILPPVKVALERQREMKLKRKGNYVFRDQASALMTPDHIRKVIWTPTLKKAGLEYRPLMQTRHTFATMAIDSGESLGWVQYMLGHSSLQMIFTTYHSWIKRATQNNGSALMSVINKSSEDFADAA